MKQLFYEAAPKAQIAKQSHGFQLKDFTLGIPDTPPSEEGDDCAAVKGNQEGVVEKGNCRGVRFEL